jgi:hypothetical protein
MQFLCHHHAHGYHVCLGRRRSSDHLDFRIWIFARARFSFLGLATDGQAAGHLAFRDSRLFVTMMIFDAILPLTHSLRRL